MIFLTGIITGVLFILLQVFPPLGVILPIYKIKKLGTLGKKEHLIVNIIAVILIAVVELNLVLVYLAFLIPEIGYYFILSKLKKFNVFDRITLVTAVSAIGFFLVYYLIFTYSDVSFDMVKRILSEKNSQFSGQELESAFNFIKNYSFYLVFLYSYLIVFIICFFFQRKSFLYWEISYLWIIPYIILFFLKYFKIFDGIYAENILRILQVIFIPYGIKSLYLSLFSFTKRKFLARIAVLLIFMYNPQLFFIYGVIFSGGEKKL